MAVAAPPPCHVSGAEGEAANECARLSLLALDNLASQKAALACATRRKVRRCARPHVPSTYPLLADHIYAANGQHRSFLCVVRPDRDAAPHARPPPALLHAGGGGGCPGCPAGLPLRSIQPCGTGNAQLETERGACNVHGARGLGQYLSSWRWRNWVRRHAHAAPWHSSLCHCPSPCRPATCCGA